MHHPLPSAGSPHPQMPDSPVSVSFQILRVGFSGEIQAYEVPAFRGAIAGKVGDGHVLFHQHEADGLRYKYPLIQYKRFGKSPAIVCLSEGVDEIHHYFQQPDWRISLSGRTLDMQVKRLELRTHTLALTPETHAYHLEDWLPFNAENYREYQQLGTLAARVAFLEKKLAGNILSFAKNLGWYVPGQIVAEIVDLGNFQPVIYKGVRLMRVSVWFRSNVLLPESIGLGGKVSVGFGVVWKD